MQAEANGINIHYQLTGPASAPVVMLSHCLAGTMGIWDHQIKILEQQYRVLRYDLRGHGATSAPDKDYSMEMLASDAAALLDALEIKRAHFMGISLGGMLGQSLALMHPEKVSSLILCDTACKIAQQTHQDWEERIAAARQHGMAALADGTMQRWLSPEFQKAHPDIAEKIRNMILATPVAGFAGCCRAIRNFDVKDKISRISVPVLIIVGENDPGTPVEMSQEIREAMSGAEMVTLPRAFHLSNIEAAELFNQTVADFLARHQ